MRIPWMTRSRLAIVAVIGLAVVVAAVIWLNLGSGAAGLDGAINGGTWAGIPVRPFEIADYTGFLGNNTGQVVTLESASLVPLKGFPAPRLAHVAVEPGKAFIASGRGWPPVRGAESFTGYRVRRGQRVQIAYGVEASKVGEYGDEGIRVTVLVGGDSVTVTVLSVAGTCVIQMPLKHDCPQSFYNHIQNAIPTDQG
jgi:hypothetical protein